MLTRTGVEQDFFAIEYTYMRYAKHKTKTHKIYVIIPELTGNYHTQLVPPTKRADLTACVFICIYVSTLDLWNEHSEILCVV
jgi:hypothetical protein